MVVLGRENTLKILREAPPGLYLDGGALGEILLPGRQMPKDYELGGQLAVFLYRDSEDRLVATTRRPLAQAGEFAALRVVDARPSLGAFLDWGLEKDLLLPRREQTRSLQIGDVVVVQVRLDQSSDRLIASMRLSRGLPPHGGDWKKGQRVQALVFEETPLGYNALVEKQAVGLLYRQNLPRSFAIGEAVACFVSDLRPDGKLDLSLHASGLARVRPLKEQILEALDRANGTLPLGDRSSPEAVYAAFGVSKKAFKQAVGALYRERKIQVTEQAITRVGPNSLR